MSAPVLSRRCWDERTVNTTDRIFGDGTHWPLPAMSLSEIHKWQKAVINLRIYGSVTPGDEGSDTVEFDFMLSEADDFTTPTELSRLSVPGLFAGKVLDDPNVNGIILQIAIGRESFFFPDNKLPVLLDSGNRYLPFWFQVDSTDGDTGHASTISTATPSAITCTFDGNPVAIYDNATAGNPTGNITIEVAPTGGYLTFGGLRDPDAGHFTSNTF